MIIRLFHDHEFSNEVFGGAAVNLAFTDGSPGPRTQE
jgi:hypothetical protein